VQPPRRHIPALLGVLFTSACTVEFIDDIIAERGVTECSTGSTTTVEASTGDQQPTMSIGCCATPVLYFLATRRAVSSPCL